MADPLTTLARVAAVRGMMQALALVGDDLHGKAGALAPVDEGTLRGSGTVVLIVNGTRYEGSGGTAQALRAAEDLARSGIEVTARAEVAFNTVYAAQQHEQIGWKHPKGGGAKYLERPLGANAQRYGRIIRLSAAREVDRAHP